MNFKKIEQKWQKFWEKNGWYPAKDFGDKPKKYVLVEFPYPSGEGLHIGHAFTMTGADVFARYNRMLGYNVLFPMGWDAFGLPTENYAIRTGIPPQKATQENTDNYRRQMKKMAFSFDWDREINTTDPDYYRWTQWIFIQLYKNGLAYKEEKPINWCPSCKIGLANEEVIDGKCERCGTEVVRRNISQWIVKITEYADRLIEGLKQTNFVKKVEAAQVNWIGRSTGVKIKFKIMNHDSRFMNQELEVFTTRPDTLWGVTFMVVAPEHDLVQQLLKDSHSSEVSRSDSSDGVMVEKIKEYVQQARKKSELERAELQHDKTGVFTGLYAINPVTKKKIPIYISDFVLSSYGTGAIMGVPAHDDRDHQFAKKFGLDIVPVVKPEGDESKGEWNFDQKAFTEVDQGIIINSGPINGLKTREAIEKTIQILEKEGVGEEAVDYHLRDWIFSRQHYWGEPIPMIYCSKCGWQPVPEEDLPIELPKVKDYEPTDTGESPLANVEDWVKTECPKCGGPARRETDTMPNWAGSNWYYLAYFVKDMLGVKSEKLKVQSIFDANMDRLEYWLPVDVYIGGDEHNTLHLLYSRFIYQFLHDIGQMPKDVPEPYYRRISHGVILGPDHQRMSKSRGNVIIPDQVWKKHGVDALRTYLMFMGPFTGTMAWNENAFQGVVRFLDKFENVVSPERCQNDSSEVIRVEETKIILNRTIKRVTEDIQRFSYNTAIAAMMECINELKVQSAKLKLEEKKKLVKLIAPFAPYLAEELWHQLGSDESVHWSKWPEYNKKYLQSEKVEIPVQVNGKLRSVIEVKSENSKIKGEVIKMAENDSGVAKYLEGKVIKKTIFIPGELVNFVV
jgi:leucyl-tRNA synthetase